jgi:gamma-glutamyltranspeptidase/glutathione hydrolase
MTVGGFGRSVRRLTRAALLLTLGLSPAACDTMSSVGNTFFGGSSGQPGHISGFLGATVADEPRAALAARDVLARGGTAADAAVALGFMLAVTYPSRAGLGGGGACIAYDPAEDSVANGVPEAVLFVAPAPASGGGDRPAAVPMVARGLFALHARYGKLPFESLLTPAEQAARFGVDASRAFVRDLAVVSGPLFADAIARREFSRDGVPLTEGQTMTQPELGSTIAQLRTLGVGDLYEGQLARRFVQASAAAGGPVSLADLRASLPRAVAPVTTNYGRDQVSVPPPPVPGGAALLAALGAPGAASPAASGGALPASTTFATLDRYGDVVVCAESMNNLFGTGRIAPTTGILLAASPASVPSPLLPVAVAWNQHLHAFRAAVGGSGQEAAATAAASALAALLRGEATTPATIAAAVPEPGRANVIACGRYLPDNDRSCAAATDPRGAGLVAGSN